MQTNSIHYWQQMTAEMLPPANQVLQRNKAITGVYAKIYKEAPKIYKWAGMAAFASYHIGLSLMPFKWAKMETIDLPSAIQQQGFKNDIQLIRLLNNHIFEDIGWVHIAYCQPNGGINILREILRGKEHYQPILAAFEKIHKGQELIKYIGTLAQGEQLIWEANTAILWHEQSAVVQPVFDKLGTVFARAMSLCATFDYKVSHTKTDWRTHSSFIMYMLVNGFDMVKETGYMPIVTNLDHRWHWISNRLIDIWRKTEKNDLQLVKKLNKLMALKE